MKKQEYNDAIHRAITEAGGNDGLWNTRFILGLFKENLRLIPYKVIRSGYVQAPKPVEGEMPYWSQSLIVPINYDIDKS